MRWGSWRASFNKMTEQLVEQRDRLVQVERVAAWRELARRLAHELKNPLFPLQTTVENLRKAQRAKFRAIRGSVSGIHGDFAGRDRESESDRGAFQRFREDAAAGTEHGEPERDRAHAW